MNDELRIMNNDSDKIKFFTDLNAWKESHKIVTAIYEITKTFPKEEIFGLVSQMRRCSVSITSNIAEGFSRQSYKEKAQFYLIDLFPNNFFIKISQFWLRLVKKASN